MHTRSYYFMHNQKQVHEHVEHNYSMQILQHAHCLNCIHERMYDALHAVRLRGMIAPFSHQLEAGEGAPVRISASQISDMTSPSGILQQSVMSK